MFPQYSYDVVNLCNSIDARFIGATPTHIFDDFTFPEIDWSLPFTSGGVCHPKFLDFCIQKVIRAKYLRSNTSLLDTFLICYSVILQVQVFLIPVKYSPPTSTCDHNMISFTVTVGLPPEDNFQLIPNFEKADYENTRLDLTGFITSRSDDIQ